MVLSLWCCPFRPVLLLRGEGGKNFPFGTCLYIDGWKMLNGSKAWLLLSVPLYARRGTRMFGEWIFQI